jgi:3-oxoacyl-[acyl-carrier protein] reductase
MDKFLAGKRAVVTGGSRGIGRAIVEQLLDAGAAVAFCARSSESVDRALAGLHGRGDAFGAPADVGNPREVSNFFRFIDEKLGGLDVLINNAGVGIFKSVADLTVDDWLRTIQTNLSGVFYCCHEALPRFRRQGHGYVINISSLAGKNPFAGGAAYNASKFGINGFTEAMMLDHRYESVRISYILPGSVNTEFGSGAGADWKIAPEDIAELTLMLLRMPQRTLVSRIEVRPSMPRK